MKNIVEYSEFQVNEKISWKHFLFAISIGLTLRVEIADYKTIKYVYDQINSSKVLNKDEEIVIEKIRIKTISIIEKDSSFLKFNRPYIIDSLKHIQFKVADVVDNKESTCACYIDITPIKNSIKYGLMSHPSRENFIILKKNKINDKIMPECIVHEMYHFLDKMLGTNKGVSDDLTLSDSILDKNIYDEEYGKNKISIILSGFKYKEGTKNIKDYVDDMYRQLIKKKDYPTSNHELYARWKTFKVDLLNDGYIKNINQKVNLDILNNSLDIKKPNFRSIDQFTIDNHLVVLFYIDVDKIEKFSF